MAMFRMARGITRLKIWPRRLRKAHNFSSDVSKSSTSAWDCYNRLWNMGSRPNMRKYGEYPIAFCFDIL